MSLYYRTPVVIAFSIPGSVLIGKYLQSGGDIYYAVGVYFAISILVLVLTATGVIKVLIKGRPGVHLSVLCRPREVHSLAKLVLKETSSLGVRISHQSKMMAHREIVEMVTAYGKVKVKLASMAPGKPVIRVTPEYEDCRKVALAANVPINDVYLAALKEASGRYLYE
ncbi:MAG: DUF111 family protein [Clostridia bacterium]|nr:DUF111 family protein [Clostridia bacterium]